MSQHIESHVGESEPPLDWSDPAHALEQLHALHARQLLSYAMTMLRQREDAEDVVQIAFLNAYAAVSDGYRPDQPLAWLVRIVRNASLNRLRTHARRPATSLDGMDLSAGRDLEDQLEQQLDAAALRSALEGLPDQQRKAIVLRELRGASYAEIAAALDTSEGAVESLIFRARRQMATTIRGRGRGHAGRSRTLVAA